MDVYILVKDYLYIPNGYGMINKRWRWQFFRQIDVSLTYTLYTIFKLYLFGWTNIHQCRRRTTVVYVSKLNCNLSFFFKLNSVKVYQSLRQYFLGTRSVFKSVKYFRRTLWFFWINQIKLWFSTYIEWLICWSCDIGSINN